MAYLAKAITDVEDAIAQVERVIEQLKEEQGPMGTQHAGEINVNRDGWSYLRAALFFLREADRRV